MKCETFDIVMLISRGRAKGSEMGRYRFYCQIVCVGKAKGHKVLLLGIGVVAVTWLSSVLLPLG